MPQTQLDSIDLRILEELQANARLTNVELASRAHLSPSPCLTRVRALEESGLISRYVTLLDPYELGLSVSVFIQITLERQVERALETFEEAIQNYPEVMECYLMTGDFDYLIRVVIPDLQAYQTFLDEKLTAVDGVEHIKSSFSLKPICYKTELPLGHII